MSLKSLLSATTSGIGSIFETTNDGLSFISEELKYQRAERNKARTIRSKNFQDDLIKERIDSMESVQKKINKSILSEEQIKEITSLVEEAFK